MVPHMPITRTEVICITVLTLCGISLRWGDLGLVHVEHFDEGVYASDIWFGPENGEHYPFQHLYAPPLFPWLTEWSITAFGPTPLGCMFWSLFFGSATVPLVWWVGRRWFGPLAGMVTAVLAAASEFHAVYSRAALTDATLLFWLIAAVWLIWEAMERDSWRWALAGGVATGIAWWTKYNGWLPLAISFAGLAGCTVFDPTTRQQFQVRLKLWAMVAGVAIIIWSPVWWSLQDVGGYSAVAVNHSGYLVGISGWWDSVIRHEAAHRVFENWGVKFEIAAWLGLITLLLRFTWNAETSSGLPSKNQALPFWLLAAVFCVISALVSTAVAIAIYGSVGIAIGMAKLKRTSPEQTSARPELAFWFAAAWFVGLSVVTPLYFPYPRLTLPWLAAGWLVAGSALAQLVEQASVPIRFRRLRISAGILLPVAWFFCWEASRADNHLEGESMMTMCFSPRDIGYGASRDDRQNSDFGPSILKTCRADCGTDQFIILVQGQPAVFFHVRAATPNVYPIATIDQARTASNSPVPVYLATAENAESVGPKIGSHGHRQSQLVQSNSRNMDEFAWFDWHQELRVFVYRLDIRD